MKLPNKEGMKDILWGMLAVFIVYIILHTVVNFSITILQDADVLYTSEEVEANKLNPPLSVHEKLDALIKSKKEQQIILDDIQAKLKLLSVHKSEGDKNGT